MLELSTCLYMYHTMLDYCTCLGFRSPQKAMIITVISPAGYFLFHCIIYGKRGDWNCFTPKAMPIVFISPVGYFWFNMNHFDTRNMNKIWPVEFWPELCLSPWFWSKSSWSYCEHFPDCQLFSHSQTFWYNFSARLW